MSSGAVRSLITGIAGQDGVLLARRLRAEGAEVVGTTRSGSAGERGVYLDGVTVVAHDVRDAAGFARLLATHEPDEVYNLAGFTSVGSSWAHPASVEEVNATAVEGLLDGVRRHRDRTGREVRLFQASSSAEDGSAQASPYARSKARAHRAVQKAREESTVSSRAPGCCTTTRARCARPGS